MTPTLPAPLRRLLTAVVAAILLLATGCTQVQLGPDTRGEYRLGELHVFADRDFATVYAATVRGMKEAKLFQTQDERRANEAELRGRDSSDTLVIVKLKEAGKNSTSVKIRYGVLQPDLPSAQKLHDAIRRHL